ncbi:MAG: hypothetical protein K8R88_02990 [Armatimonadetes bacterium]|nr:hypothetical protein [Armatimonadota bacterium]
MIKAVIDVGSNSILLLVSRQRNDKSWETLFESTSVTGLGRGVKQSGEIGVSSARESLLSLRTMFDTAREYGADNIFAGGTMALRIAKNAGDFVAAANSQSTPVIVISGQEEATLGFMAVANDSLFAEDSRISIIDPGGNSTELVTARRSENGWITELRRSFEIGALGLRDGVLSEETPTLRARLQASAQIDDLLAFRYLPGQCGRIVTLGATGTNLISIREKLSNWQPEKIHGQVLDFEEISKAVGWMFNMTDQERAAIPGIEKGREMTLHIGCLILERFLQAIHGLECIVSVRGWRHALLDTTLEDLRAQLASAVTA